MAGEINVLPYINNTPRYYWKVPTLKFDNGKAVYDSPVMLYVEGKGTYRYDNPEDALKGFKDFFDKNSQYKSNQYWSSDINRAYSTLERQIRDKQNYLSSYKQQQINVYKQKQIDDYNKKKTEYEKDINNKLNNNLDYNILFKSVPSIKTDKGQIVNLGDYGSFINNYKQTKNNADLFNAAIKLIQNNKSVYNNPNGFTTYLAWALQAIDKNNNLGLGFSNNLGKAYKFARDFYNNNLSKYFNNSKEAYDYYVNGKNTDSIYNKFKQNYSDLFVSYEDKYGKFNYNTTPENNIVQNNFSTGKKKKKTYNTFEVNNNDNNLYLSSKNNNMTNPYEDSYNSIKKQYEDIYNKYKSWNPPKFDSKAVINDSDLRNYTQSLLDQYKNLYKSSPYYSDIFDSNGHLTSKGQLEFNELYGPKIKQKAQEIYDSKYKGTNPYEQQYNEIKSKYDDILNKYKTWKPTTSNNYSSRNNSNNNYTTSTNNSKFNSPKIENGSVVKNDIYKIDTLGQVLEKMKNMSPEQIQKIYNDPKWGSGGFDIYYNKVLSNSNDENKKAYVRKLKEEVNSKLGNYMQGQQEELGQIAKKLNNGQDVPIGTSVQKMLDELGYNKKFDDLNSLITSLKSDLSDQNSDLNKKLQDYYSKTDQLLSDKISGLKDDIGSSVNKQIGDFKNEVNNQISDLNNNLYNRLTSTETNINNTISELGNKLGLQLNEINDLKNSYDILKQRIEINNDLLKSQNKIWDTTFDSIKNNLRDLSAQYGTTYKKIEDRITAYETDIKDTYKKMEDNLKQIGDNYEKVLKFNQAAAGSAAEKMLRGAGGKGTQLRISNYLKGMADKGDVELAKLQTQLLNSQNGLEKELLNLKNQVMNDKNITDKEKMKILGDINEKYNDLLEANKDFKIKLAQLKVQPYNDYLDYKQQQVSQIENTQLKQQIQKLDYERQNKPENREMMISKIVEKLQVPVPKDVIQKAKNANSLLEAMEIIYNYTNDQKSKQLVEAIKKAYSENYSNTTTEESKKKTQ